MAAYNDYDDLNIARAQYRTVVHKLGAFAESNRKLRNEVDQLRYVAMGQPRPRVVAHWLRLKRATGGLPTSLVTRALQFVQIYVAHDGEFYFTDEERAALIGAVFGGIGHEKPVEDETEVAS